MGRLDELWKLCHISDREKAGIHDFMNEMGTYSPLTLEAISKEIIALEERYKRESILLKVSI
jgi:hypothetical protein